MRTYAVAVGDRIFRTVVHQGPASLIVEVDGVRHAVDLERWLGRTHVRLLVDGTPHRVVIRPQGETTVVVVGADRYTVRVAPHVPVARRVQDSAAPTALQITAPMPGLVVSVEVVPGARVEQGRPVAIMEAMKMQMEIHAPASGWVRAVHVRGGQDVATGTVLMTLELADP
jgi:biotin carboxyl carrier protein